MKRVHMRNSFFLFLENILKWEEFWENYDII